MTGKPADLGSKRLIGLAPGPWVQWLLDDPSAQATDVLAPEFQWVSRESDVLLRAHTPASGDFLVLTEVQLHYRNDMPLRMRSYAGLAAERYKVPVLPVLVNILEPARSTEIPDRYFSEFMGLVARQDYRVINLWQVDAWSVLEKPLLPLVPFTPAMAGGGDPQALRRAVNLLRADDTLSELEPLLAFFASFVLDTQLIRSIMRWDMAVLRESPWYYEILQEGIEQGIEQGIEEGIEQGIEEGRRKTALDQLAHVLRHRFGALPAGLPESLASQPTERLLALFDVALDAESLASFQSALRENGVSGADLRS